MDSSAPRHPSRRLVLAGAALTLAGCSSRPDGPAATALRLAGDVFEQEAFTAEDVERTPYASIGVRPGDKAEAMVVLATVAGPDLHWIAADHTLIVTRHGRIVRWQGPSGAVAEVEAERQDPVGDGQLGAEGAATCMRLLDFPRERRYGIVARSSLSAAGTAPVALLHGEAVATRYVETGRAPQLDWDFQNEFYLDPASRLVLRSVQQISPALPPIEIRILRPYGGEAV